MRTARAATPAALMLAPLLALALLQDQSHDGVWKLNVAKSDAGDHTPPPMTMKITSRPPEFEVLQTTDSSEILLKFRDDGKEAVNTLPGGAVMRSTHRHQNGMIVGEYRISTPEGLIRQSDRIAYSPDGKAMIMDREIKTEQGSFRLKLVFEKQ